MTDLFGGFFDDLSDFLGNASDDLEGLWDTTSDFLGLNKGKSSSGGGKVNLPAPTMPTQSQLDSGSTGGLGRELTDAAKGSPVPSVDPGQLYSYWRGQLGAIKSNIQGTK